MKKFNAILGIFMLAVMPTLQAHAQEVSIEQAIKKLDIALESGNEASKKLAIDTFTMQVSQLQASGASSQDLIKALKAKMPDAKTAQDVETLAKVAKERGLDAKGTSALVADYMQKAKVNGAAWSDAATYTVISIAVIALIIVVLASGGSVSIGVYDDYYWTTCYSYDSWGYYYEYSCKCSYSTGYCY